MARCRLSRVLPYAPEELFDLVGDVRRYPEFVPWINAMRVWNEREVEPGVSTLDAEAGVGFSFLRERFATRVKRDAEARRIDVQLLNGPFRRLHAVWSFAPHPVGTELKFEIDFEFKAKLLEHMLAANLERATAKLVACFETRANALFTPLRAAVRGSLPAKGSGSATGGAPA
jgi:coenzyme Q-binding protein COQ10